MRRTVVAFVLSVLTHPLLAAAVWGLSILTQTPRPERTEARPVVMRAMSSAQWEKNRGQREEILPSGQVVAVPKGNLQKPQDSKFLAETDNRVTKQTQAREKSDNFLKPAAKKQPSSSGVSLSNQFAAFDRRDGARPRLGAIAPVAPDQPTSTETPSVGGAPANDVLDGIETDESTALNTREFRYASFFNRVKQAVKAKWDPDGRLKALTTRKSIFTTKMTLLNVTLRPDGSLAEVYVIEPSGIDALDAEAVGAFERAAPFPNPPPGLIRQGLIRFSFGFTVENGYLPAMRPLWQ